MNLPLGGYQKDRYKLFLDVNLLLDRKQGQIDRRNFFELVSSCRIYEEDIKAHYKAVNERKGKGQQSRPKPYSAPADKGKQRVNEEAVDDGSSFDITKVR